MNERVKELDSLRGISIILVIAFHSFGRVDFFIRPGARFFDILHFIKPLTTIGWVGVDIFFVLSGFLITSILLKTKNEKNYFKNFYTRRALRIFPLYFVFLVVILLLIPIIDPEYKTEIHRSLPILLLYQQNWLVLFDKIPLTPYLGVTWSLAIEEQFYLVWPAIVFFTRKETLIKISVGIIVFSILARILGILLGSDHEWMAEFFYYNTFTRFEQLVFGGLLAVAFTFPVWRERLRLMSAPIFVIALAGFIAVCIPAYPKMVPFDPNTPLVLGGETLAAIFSTALIAMLLIYPERSAIRKLFQSNVLNFWGKYSYSAYLLHMPVILLLFEPLMQTGIKGTKMYVAYIILVYGLTALGSLLTWNLLEKHMLNLKKYFEYQ